MAGNGILDNRSLTEHGGGISRVGVGGNVATLLLGARKLGEAGGALRKETLAWGDFETLVEGLVQSRWSQS